MTLYLTDNTPPDEIRRARESGFVHAVKLYPAGATTNSDAGVTEHREVREDARSDAEARHAAARARRSDRSGDRHVRSREGLHRPGDDAVAPRFPGAEGRVRAHHDARMPRDYVARCRRTRLARDASPRIICCTTAMRCSWAASGRTTTACRCSSARRIAWRWSRRRRRATAKFFLGTDSAPHAKGLKEHACGCAGCYTALHALELYAEAFDQAGALDRLEGFASFYGADFYGLPRCDGERHAASRTVDAAGGIHGGR